MSQAIICARARTRARARAGRRQQFHFAVVGLVEVFNDRLRLADHALAIDQHRHQLLWIDRAEFVATLFAVRQVHIHLLVRQAFEVQGNAHAIARARTPIAVQLQADRCHHTPPALAFVQTSANPA
jgi:hypothetical protein